MTAAHLDPTRRHDVVLLFDVTDGNPNGDPDLQGAPRTDEETGHGLVTDVAIKRRIRDTVALLRPGDPRAGIFVEAGHALNTRWQGARQADPDNPLKTICDWYWDVRMFGSVLTAGKGNPSAGIRGPVQCGFARTLDPVLPTNHTITRVTQTRQEDIDKGESTEIGSKWTIPYGLYRARLHYSPAQAHKTGVTSDDLALLWQAIEMMFAANLSATGGIRDVVGLHVFSHPNALGVASAGALTGRIRHVRAAEAPRAHSDYQPHIRSDDLPEGVVLTTLVDAWA
ncbi:type I-C CRISPR-associated protein Cas7/Csd2 [Salinispora arenicola]|uniref:type I-C CRISPR-associated protein Cas7/Csd2 n=1 Tax=Salinispora arenicola TaxID=168697 RepID=UPI00037F175F|nr:type I-C CRISPR-associated protein Cas7/Csd2 [Salinispora arenicola]